jgi:crossover junction endodeoxyribonuclease RuvC
MIIGIDPGLRGGIACIAFSGELVQVYPMPVVADEVSAVKLKEILTTQNQPIWHVFIESAQAFPKQGISSTFRYGMGFGLVLGVVSALDLPYTLVKPKAWQLEAHKGTAAKLDPKKKSLLAVERLFPKEAFKATSRSKVAHDGMVDATLIAAYGFISRYKQARSKNENDED